MTRLKQAWLALCGKLVPEVRIERVPVLGEPHIVHLYLVRRLVERDVYFTTCEQAMEKHYSAEKVMAVVVGGEHFVGHLERVTVEPKPKIAKGKKSK
jgi:hypothetical protein